jgi:hypothetical protein
VIDAEIDLRAYAERFAHLRIVNTGDVLKTEALYLERSGRALLIQAVAVEAGRTQTFYVRVAAQERGSVSVRIDPLTRPERSEGVKRIVAAIGADLLTHTPGSKVRTTNLVLPSLGSAPEGHTAPPGGSR